MTVLVTGGFGFIGSAFIRDLVARGEDVVNIDVRTYAADPRRLGDAAGQIRSHIIDVADPELVTIVREESPSVIVHFAAESHVTRSESDASRFYRTNVDGTKRVFEAALEAEVDQVVHVSTDEIYGPCPDDPFSEDQKLPGEGAATSAYARSKALADDVATEAFKEVPTVVVRPSNCFGPWQHPEKAIPRWTIRALSGQPIPVWGDGRYVRDWMAVHDLTEAIALLIERRITSDVFNVAPEDSQKENVEVARMIARAAQRDEAAVVLTRYDRPKHDRRYAIDASKMRSIGWKPSARFESALAATVDWYRDNQRWWQPLVDSAEALYQDAAEATT